MSPNLNLGIAVGTVNRPKHSKKKKKKTKGELHVCRVYYLSPESCCPKGNITGPDPHVGKLLTMSMYFIFISVK